MTFGEYIRANGFTAKSLAEKAGVSIRTLECYTTGRFPWGNSRLWFASKVAAALGITTDKLTEFDQ